MKRLLQKIIRLDIRLRYKFNILPIYDYKIGDKIKYNWKGKIFLGHIIKDKQNDTLIINEIKHRRNEFIGYKNTSASF